MERSSKVLLFCGEYGSGKDEAVNHLKLQKFAFASLVKDITSVAYDLDRELLEGVTDESRKWREEPLEYWSSVLGVKTTPRDLIIKTGMTFREKVHPDFWVIGVERQIRLFHKIDNKRHCSITDARFLNEISHMINTFDALLILIDRFNVRESDIFKEVKKLKEEGKYDNDAIKRLEEKYKRKQCEFDWMGEHYHIIIENTSTLDDYYKFLVLMIYTIEKEQIDRSKTRIISVNS